MQDSQGEPGRLRGPLHSHFLTVLGTYQLLCVLTIIERSDSVDGEVA